MGDYWREGEPRPQLVPVGDPEGLKLEKETKLRAHAVLVQETAREYAATGSAEVHAELVMLVAAWPGKM